MRAYRLAYDGRPFHGFQRQPDVPTVEDALFDALRSLDVLDVDGDAPAGYSAAGRTDAGVSAVAQTVAFAAPAWCSPAALNSELPGDLRAWAVAEVPDAFHATHDAVRREYTYFLYGPALSAERARAAADALAGEHDLHNLTPDDANTVRELSLSVDRDGDFLVLTVAAGGFSRELVRRVAALVRAVAGGDAALSKVDRVLAPDPLPGPAGIPAAPATPLVLTGVTYPGVDFAVDADAAGSARAVFAERATTARTVARAMAAVRDGID